MARIVFVCWWVLMVQNVAGCSRIREVPTGTFPVMSLDEVNANGESVAGTLTQKGGGVIIKIEKGQSIPVKLEVEAQITTLSSGDNSLVFERQVFMMIGNNEFCRGLCLSPDGKQFAPIYEVRDLKKLFGIRAGSISVGFKVLKDDGATIVMGIKTY